MLSPPEDGADIATLGCHRCGVVLEIRYLGKGTEEVIIKPFGFGFAYPQSPCECLWCHAVENAKPSVLARSRSMSMSSAASECTSMGRFGVVTMEEPLALGEMGVETRFLLAVVRLIEAHPSIGDDDWTDDFSEIACCVLGKPEGLARRS